MVSGDVGDNKLAAILPVEFPMFKTATYGAYITYLEFYLEQFIGQLIFMTNTDYT